MKLNGLSYNNDLPVDDNGNIINFIDLQYDLNDKLHQQQAKNRQKKYEDIISIRNETSLTINELVNKYKHCASSIKKYLKMTDDEVENVKNKRNNKRKKTEFSKYKNIVFKMLKDNQPYEYIIAYVLKSGYKGTITALKGDIYKLAKNNNLEGVYFNKYNKYEYASDQIIITRRDLLKYLLTLNRDKTKNEI